MAIPAPEAISYMIAKAIQADDQERPRAIQKSEGRLGPSDIGFCHQQAVLVARGTPPSDATPLWSAIIGTALGERVESGLAKMFPTWLLGSVHKQRVEYVLPNAAVIGGIPDIIVPEWNAVLDIKTKDGLAYAKRSPWVEHYLFQTWLYVAGCRKAGLLDPTRPAYQGLVYVDRSGKIDRPHVVLTEWDLSVEDRINEWVGDVIYALQNKEDGYQDIPAPVCERICEFFTVCRGALPTSDPEPITDPYLLEVIEMFVEGREMTVEGKAMQDDAKGRLFGVNGATTKHTVRWIHVDESRDGARSAYDRLDIRDARGRAQVHS